MSLVSIRRISKVDTTKSVSHKRVTQFEIKLREHIEPIIKEIMNSNLDSSSIYFNYQKQISDLFHTFIELFYRVGIIYVNKANGMMPRQTDLDNEQIKNLTEFATNLLFKKIIGYNEREVLIDKTNFFVSIQNKIMETFDSIIDKPVKTIPKSLNIEKQIDSTIRTIAFLTLNTSVIMKQRQLTDSRNNQIIKYAAKLEKITNLVWVTALDERVCWKYCRPLQGTVFDIHNANIAIPVISTHPNCRCRLMTIDEKGNIFEDVTSGFIQLEESGELSTNLFYSVDDQFANP
jgi:SPP1 gp7 family putative phage head morphogenesis protein